MTFYTAFSEGDPVVPSTFNSRFDEIGVALERRAYDVKALGAVGDGVTDDATILQSAINTAEAAGGGTVLLPEGTYALSTGLIVDSIGVTITGIGNRNVVLKATSAIVVLTVANNRIGLRDFQIDGNSIATCGVKFTNGRRSVANNVFVTGVAGNGWEISPHAASGNCNNIVIFGCEGNSCTGNGLEVMDGSSADITALELYSFHANNNGENGAIIRGGSPVVFGGLFTNNAEYGIRVGESGDTQVTQEGFLYRPWMEANGSGSIHEGVGHRFLVHIRDGQFPNLVDRNTGGTFSYVAMRTGGWNLMGGGAANRRGVMIDGNTINAQDEDSDNLALQLAGKGTGVVRTTGDLEVDGAFNHDGTTLGLYGTAPVTQGTALTDLDTDGSSTTTEIEAAINAINDRLRRTGFVAT